MDPRQMGPMLTPREVVRGLERVRRQRLVRIVSLGVLVPTLLLLPGAFSDKGVDVPTLIGIVAAIAGAALAFLFNRLNLVTTAAYVLLVGLLCAIGWDIASKPLSQTGLDLNDLRLYGFFVLPVLLSGVLSGRRGPFVIGGIAIAFTVASLIILPKTATLQAYWDGRYQYAPGMSYDVVAVPVVIVILTSVVAWLGADSVGKALLRASRADELAAANERVVAQAREIELQRRRLQDGIGHMQQVHMAFARGQFDARARVPEGELLPLAISLNQLLDQLARLAREQDLRMRMEHGAHDLAAALKRMRAGGPYIPPDYTGTPLDDALVELATLRQMAPAPAGPSRPFPPDAAQPQGMFPGMPQAGPGPIAASPSRAPGWSFDAGMAESRAAQPSMEGDGGGPGGAYGDAGGPANPPNPPSVADPVGPPGSLDPRDLLPDWLRGE